MDIPFESDNTTIASGSMIDKLRARRDYIGENRTETFPVPGYNGELVYVGKYNKDLWDRFKVIGERTDRSRSERKLLYAQADSLVAACDHIAIRKDGKLVSIGEAIPGYTETPDEAVTFDRTLAKMFDLKRPDGAPISEAEDATQREICMAVINNPLGVTSLFLEVAEWLESGEGDEEYLGESSGARKSV